jgi:hypothetical protein
MDIPLPNFPLEVFCILSGEPLVGEQYRYLELLQFAYNQCKLVNTYEWFPLKARQDFNGAYLAKYKGITGGTGAHLLRLHQNVPYSPPPYNDYNEEQDVFIRDMSNEHGCYGSSFFEDLDWEVINGKMHAWYGYDDDLDTNGKERCLMMNQLVELKGIVDSNKLPDAPIDAWVLKLSRALESMEQTEEEQTLRQFINF